MLQTPPRTSERTDWILAAAWTLFIYTVIPFARTIQAWVDEHAGRVWFGYATYAAVAAGLVLLAAQARRGRLTLTPARWAGLAALALCYAAGAYHLRANPEEALHLVEYGILSVLLLRAFSHRHRNRAAHAAALLAGAWLGAFDEIIQWITPRRFFDVRDICINILAGALMQAGWAWMLRPPYLAAAAPAESLRLVRRLAMAVLLLLLACSANTPERQQHYRRRLPFLNETMVEYGHRHRIGEGIVFHSRLSPPELAAEDARRAEDAGAALREEGGDGDYEAFLTRHNLLVDPMLYELRIHLFRRDRYWKEARKHRDEPAREAGLLAIAVGENRIVEHSFPRSLAASGLAWPPDLRERAESIAKPGPYTSPVSDQLFTRLTERQVQGVLAGLLLVTWLGGRYYERRSRA